MQYWIELGVIYGSGAKFAGLPAGITATAVAAIVPITSRHGPARIVGVAACPVRCEYAAVICESTTG